MSELLRITPKDNVAVALSPITKGQTVSCGDLQVTAMTDVPAGHKIALEDISPQEHIIKYGFPIGYAKEAIAKGSHIHVHNLHTLLGGTLDYTWAASAFLPNWSAASMAA